MKKNERELKIADIRHNIECVDEAIKEAKTITDKKKFIPERNRLGKLLLKYERNEV